MERFRLGQLVEVANEDSSRGTIRWLGSGEFAPGDWLGLELEEPVGKNDGEVKGKRYFRCRPDHGMMVRPDAVRAIIEQPPAEPVAKAANATKRSSVLSVSSNGTKPTRPLAGPKTGTVAAPSSRRQTLVDPTSKRQSINAASPTPAARTSIARGVPSPTKTARQSMARPPSIGGAPKPTAAPPARTVASSTSLKRASITGRPTAAAPATTSARTTRPSALTSTAGVAKAPAPASARKPASRLSTLSQPAIRRTGPVGSRSESTEQGEDGDDSVEPQSLTVSPSKATMPDEKHLFSPPASAREPPSPHLSRPTTQQLSAQNRKIDDLETKIRILEKQKGEDKERLKELDRIGAERDKLDGIIQKLQAKIQPQSQEITQLRKDLRDMEARATTAEESQTGFDDVLEVATLDKEMAEELAETYKSELAAVRAGHEELTLEVEVLKAENEELGREMSPGERDNMGFAQLQRSNIRLKEALIRLRDITQDTEADLKEQIKDLQDDSQELGTVKTKFEEAQEQLTHQESVMEELKQQLETAQGAEEMIEELTEKNMALAEQIETLKGAVEDLESLKEINDELELNHVEHEKSMQEDIDYRESLLLEQARKMSDQDEVVEELDYTVSRFRELVANLNSDLEELRASQQITEAEASELTNRSKAIEDLNLRLQHSASKTQVKAIDTELKRLEAQEAHDHLAIVQMFLPETYASHRDSVSAFLRFKRVSFKALMLHGFVKDKVSGLAVPGHEDDMFAACDVLDRLVWISAMCNRFVKHVISCSLDAFGLIGNATYDLEPVERTFNGFMEAVKRDDLKHQQCAADLQRTMSVLEHLGERYLGEGLADFAEAVHMRTLVMQSRLDTSASAIAHIKSIAQARVILPSDADETDEEEAQNFLKKADDVVGQIRSVRVIAGKALHQLEELQARSLTLEPSTMNTIENTESVVGSLASNCKAAGFAVAKLVNEDERIDSLTFEQVIRAVAAADETPFSSLASTMSGVVTAVQSFSTLTTTIAQTVEFEAAPVNDLSANSTPWAQLAARMREESSASAGNEAEIARLHDQVSERNTALAMKDKTISELNVSVEVHEKRASDSIKATSRARDLDQQLQTEKRKIADFESKLSRAVEDVRVLRIEKETLIASGASRSGNEKDGNGAAQGDETAARPDFATQLANDRAVAALESKLHNAELVIKWLRSNAVSPLDGLAELSERPIEKPSIRSAARSVFKELRSSMPTVVELQPFRRGECLRHKPAKEIISVRSLREREVLERFREHVEIIGKEPIGPVRIVDDEHPEEIEI